MYYEYLLNIDVSVYQQKTKERGMIEFLTLRADTIKKIMAALYYEGERFMKVSPEL